MSASLLDSIREFAGRPWQAVARASEAADDERFRRATASQLLAINDAVARFIRERRGSSASRADDLAHHLAHVRSFDAIAERRQQSRR
ncbi:MAG TPA: hypothetical protein VND91_03815 [Candidatus Saccharimonadia bacterium]|nr:hypothetical protein [Candidatus Saccharimonadia bacterium]